LSRWVDRAYDDAEFGEELDGFVAAITDSGYRNSLCQKLLLLCCPGVPDLYQGTELWDFSLVDPDNRRPVDYALRQQLLSELPGADAATLWARRKSGGVKLHLIRESLAIRSRHIGAFTAPNSYTPLTVHEDTKRRCLAFARGKDVIVVVGRFWQRHDSAFGGATLALPEGRWNNVLCRSGPFHGGVGIAELLGPLPCALLERTPSK
jgi:(1->4)-alpha-D-glucan 1-alpha-D-glucosylmutase